MILRNPTADSHESLAIETLGSLETPIKSF